MVIAWTYQIKKLPIFDILGSYFTDIGLHVSTSVVSLTYVLLIIVLLYRPKYINVENMIHHLILFHHVLSYFLCRSESGLYDKIWCNNLLTVL